MPMRSAPSGSIAARRCGRCGGCPTTCRCRCFEAAVAREQPDENAKPLPQMPLPEQVVADYQTIRLSLKGHPMEFLREMFTKERVVACQDVNHTQRQAPRPLRRRGAGAAAAGQRQGRRLHDAGGRDRHRQYRGVAEGDGAVPQGSDGRPPHPGRGLYPEQPGTSDASGGAADVRPLPRSDRPRQ